MMIKIIIKTITKIIVALQVLKDTNIVMQVL